MLEVEDRLGLAKASPYFCRGFEEIWEFAFKSQSQLVNEKQTLIKKFVFHSF